MIHRYLSRLALAGLLAAAVASAPAQSTSTQPAPAPAAPPANSATTTIQAPKATPAPLDEPLPTLRIGVNEVNLVFAVTDKRGRFITGLRQEDFGLLDDGRPPEAVLRFVQQTNLPLRVGIMLDTSSSIRSRFKFEQDSAVDFLLQTLHQNDRAFVEGFDVQTDLEQDYTNRFDLLSTAINRLRPGGGTALYDALYKTCRDQMLTLRQDEAIRKVIIMVTDGEDDYSRVLLSEAIKECQRAETNVYTISTNTSASKTKGDDVVREIAESTGGAAFYPEKLEDIAVYFTDIQQELRSQYQLVYRPANFKNDGSFRTIYLQVHNSGYFVRTMKGYFAPRPPQ